MAGPAAAAADGSDGELSEVAAPGAGMRLAALAAAAFLAVVALAWWMLENLDPPGPTAWSGIAPLERKLDHLERFAARGELDALVLGSSIVDFGFSAELFSRLMSAHLGRPWRAYNFATGGAEPRTLPKLYRIARTVAKPRALIVVVPPEPRLGDTIDPGTPDYTLAQAPVGRALAGSDARLRASRELWKTPLLRTAPALREAFLSGGLGGLGRAVGMEAYALSAHGDRVSYLVAWKAEELALLKRQQQMAVRPFQEPGADAPERLERMLEFYFARPDSAAIAELAELAKRDGVELHLVSHAGAATFVGAPIANASFEQARADFFKAFAAGLGAHFHDAAAGLSLPRFAVSDTVHLNAHGAEAFTRRAFEAFSGARAPAPGAIDDPALALPPEDIVPTRDPSFSPHGALLLRPAGGPHPLLRFRAVVSFAVPPLPDVPLRAALRLPGGGDVVVPAWRIGTGDFVAEVDLAAAARPEALLLRILGPDGEALPAPIAAYEWVSGYPAMGAPVERRPTLLQRAALLAMRPFMSRVTYDAAQRRARSGWSAAENPGRGEAPAGAVELLALPAVRQPGDALHVAMRRPSSDAPLAFALHGAGLQLELGTSGAHRDVLLTTRLPPSLPPGDYRLEARAGPAAVAHATLHVRAQEGAGARAHPVHVAPLRVATPPVSREPVVVAGAAVPRGPPPAALVHLPRLDVDARPRLAGGTVRVAWSRVPRPAANDWIGLFPAGGSPESRLDMAFTGGAGEGSMAFPVSGVAPRLGLTEYEFRLYAAGTWTLLAQSRRVRFDAAAAASQARVSVDAHPRISAGSVRVAWSGVEKPSPHDWIGLFAIDAPAEARLELATTGGRAEGTVSFPLSAVAPRVTEGEYEFRLYGAGWTLLARSEPVRFLP